MKITHIGSACVLIESGGIKILCDPWITGEVYYGSWAHYPKLEFDKAMFDDIDYIYVSHIHPDHMGADTFEWLQKDIPVLVHNYEEKFVVNTLKKYGMKNIIELKHGGSFECSKDFKIYIYASDDCNPENCFKFFGCGKSKSLGGGSLGIDTIAVFTDGKYTVVNTNDSQYELSLTPCKKILMRFGNPDVLLHGYHAAGSYPQCWSCYSDEEKMKMADMKKEKFLNIGLQYLNLLKPKYYMPFAGTYTLAGKLAELEKFKGTIELQNVLKLYQEKYKTGEGFALNSFEHFDLETGQCSKEYVPIDLEKKAQYVEDVLKHQKYDYEYDDEPTLENILRLVSKSYDRYDKKREEIQLSTKTNIYIYLPENKMVKILADATGYDIIDCVDFDDDRYVTYKVDYKLLYRILSGPRLAHWNNAEIGSHIEFSRKPEIFERKLYHSMNFFHA